MCQVGGMNTLRCPQCHGTPDLPATGHTFWPITQNPEMSKAAAQHWRDGLFCGLDGIRTHDLLFRRQTLYPLSYKPVRPSTIPTCADDMCRRHAQTICTNDMYKQHTQTHAPHGPAPHAKALRHINSPPFSAPMLQHRAPQHPAPQHADTQYISVASRRRARFSRSSPGSGIAKYSSRRLRTGSIWSR